MVYRFGNLAILSVIDKKVYEKTGENACLPEGPFAVG